MFVFRLYSCCFQTHYLERSYHNCLDWDPLIVLVRVSCNKNSQNLVIHYHFSPSAWRVFFLFQMTFELMTSLNVKWITACLQAVVLLSGPEVCAAQFFSITFWINWSLNYIWTGSQNNLHWLCAAETVKVKLNLPKGFKICIYLLHSRVSYDPVELKLIKH